MFPFAGRAIRILDAVEAEIEKDLSRCAGVKVSRCACSISDANVVKYPICYSI